MTTKVTWAVNGKQQEILEKNLGEVPIMIKVNHGFFFITIILPFFETVNKLKMLFS